jgi:hypothetical protein
MLTLRIHLDPVGPDNAPQLVMIGSHRFGRVAEGDIRTRMGARGPETAARIQAAGRYCEAVCSIW